MTASRPRETVVRPADVRSHGLQRHEQEIMDLFDAGRSIQDIADVTSRSLRTIEATVQRYHVGGVDAWAQRARQSSAALLAAIVRHHPELRGVNR